MSLRVVAIVPARAGSKRVPGKNGRFLEGRPLLFWTLDVALKSTGIECVLVSTDDAKLAELARDAGALVPWLRPPELATDHATSVDVCVHALDWYEAQYGAVDALMLLQPTTPFRTKSSIEFAIEKFRREGAESLVSLSPSPCHPAWMFTIDQGKMKSILIGESYQVRSQDLSPVYSLNGSIYLATPDFIRTQRSLIGESTVPIVSESNLEAIDIDTEWDWKIAEVIAKIFREDFSKF